MGCYASTFQKAPTSAYTMPMTLRPWALLNTMPRRILRCKTPAEALEGPLRVRYP